MHMILKLRGVRTPSDVFGVPVPFRHLVCIGPMQDRTREGLVGTRLLPNSGAVHGSLAKCARPWIKGREVRYLKEKPMRYDSSGRVVDQFTDNDIGGVRGEA